MLKHVVCRERDKYGDLSYRPAKNNLQPFLDFCNAH